MQKATELGVTAHRAGAHRAQRRAPGCATRRERKLQHWRAIASPPASSAGATACRRWRPGGARGFPAQRPSPSTRLLLSPAATAAHRDMPRPAPVTVLIGPEGGLDARGAGARAGGGVRGRAPRSARAAHRDRGDRRARAAAARVRRPVGARPGALRSSAATGGDCTSQGALMEDLHHAGRWLPASLLVMAAATSTAWLRRRSSACRALGSTLQRRWRHRVEHRLHPSAPAAARRAWRR